MSYLGDFNVNQTVYLPFPSTNANGTPTALANGTAVVYRNNNLTEATANLTLNTSLDSRAGFNMLTIDMSLNQTFYATGNEYTAVLTVGDVAGVSVANMPLGNWSVNNRPATLHSSAANTTLSSINTSLTAGTFNAGGGVTMPNPLNTYGQFDTQTADGTSLTLPSRPVGSTGAIMSANGTVTWRGDGGNAAESGAILAAGAQLPIANTEQFRWKATTGVVLNIQWLR